MKTRMRRKQPTLPLTVPRRIETPDRELHCHRSINFTLLEDRTNTDASFDNGIRVYSGHVCAGAVLQLRGIGPITTHGKPRRMIATASYLDRQEVRALIAKLQEIERTLPED